MGEFYEIAIKSPAGAPDEIFRMLKGPNDLDKDNFRELRDCINCTLFDVEELNANKPLLNGFSTVNWSSWDSISTYCAFYNSCVEDFVKSWKPTGELPKFCQRQAKFHQLKYIMALCYNRAIDEPDKLNQYPPFSPQVYGETSFDLIQQMFESVSTNSEDTFIDLGSGVGQVVLQVAASTNVKFAYGIEKADYPSQCAMRMDKEFRRWMAFFGKPYQPYEACCLVQGDFLSSEYENRIELSTIVFANNFAFGPEVDYLLSRRFSHLPEGARIISSKSFCSRNKRLSDRRLGDLSSIVKLSLLDPVNDGVSWTDKPFSYYVHTIDRSPTGSSQSRRSTSNTPVRCGQKRRRKAAGRRAAASKAKKRRTMRSASQAEVVPDMDESSQAQTQSSHPDSIAETEDSSGGDTVYRTPPSNQGLSSQHLSSNISSSPSSTLSTSFTVSSSVSSSPISSDSHAELKVKIGGNSKIKVVSSMDPIETDENIPEPILPSSHSHRRYHHCHRYYYDKQSPSSPLRSHLKQLRRLSQTPFEQLGRPEFFKEIREAVALEKQRQTQLMWQVNGLQETMKSLHLEGRHLLTAFTNKLGMLVNSPTSFFSEARRIIRHHRDLETKVAELREELARLAEYQAELLQRQAVMEEQLKQGVEGLADAYGSFEGEILMEDPRGNYQSSRFNRCICDPLPPPPPPELFPEVVPTPPILLPTDEAADEDSPPPQLPPRLTPILRDHGNSTPLTTGDADRDYNYSEYISPPLRRRLHSLDSTRIESLRDYLHPSAVPANSPQSNNSRIS